MVAVDEQQLRWERACELGLDVLDEARVQLMLKFRFLDRALWRMEAEPFAIRNGYALATDGSKVYYDADLLLGRFQESFDELVRDYLQLVMHCIFRHPFDEAHDRTDAWWLTCDIIAESAALELCGGRFPSEQDVARRQALSELKLLCGVLTPGRLYQLLVKAYSAPQGSVYQGLGPGRLNELAALFQRDNHEAWPGYGEGPVEEKPGEVQELEQPDESSTETTAESELKEMMASGESANDQENRNERPQDAAGDSQSADEEESSGASDEASEASETDQADEGLESSWQGTSSSSDETEEVHDEKSAEERDWEEIAKQIEVNLETFSKEWGEEAGSLMASLRIANRKRYDYSEFLRRFAQLTEEMKVNDDEYDYIFYTYGLKLYGDMPLIEPLEYKETQRIRDFVIAIDTSESCQGDLIKRFLEHTFTILKNQEDFAHKVNIHVIQCDAKVQADTRIQDLRAIDSFLDGFFVRGMGGTDFRPVFGYIDDLRAQGELSEMKGLLYFTDGLGTFPEKAPDFDTAFVFVDTGEALTPKVPPWAMKVVLDEEGIGELKQGV